MDEPLPRIRIPLREPPFAVLERLHVIALSLGMTADFEPWLLVGSDAGRMLVITPAEGFRHMELHAKLIADNPSVNCLHVRILALGWEPDDPPKHATYLRAAKDLLQPLLVAYRRNHGLRYRLGIHIPRLQRRCIPQEARQRLDLFIHHANFSVLASSDWDLFYAFIRHCHNRRVLMDPWELKVWLKQAGFDEERASSLSNIYRHGRGILQRRLPTVGPSSRAPDTATTGGTR